MVTDLASNKYVTNTGHLYILTPTAHLNLIALVFSYFHHYGFYHTMEL